MAFVLLLNFRGFSLGFFFGFSFLGFVFILFVFCVIVVGFVVSWLFVVLRLWGFLGFVLLFPLGCLGFGFVWVCLF